LDKTKLDRISFLARKSKNEGLNEQEKKEQAELRQEYLATIRANFRATLDNIEFTDKK